MTIFKTPQDTRAARGLKPTTFVHTCQEMQQLHRRLTTNSFDDVLSADVIACRDVRIQEEGQYVYGVVNGKTEMERQLSQAFHPIVVPMPKIGNEPAYNILVGDVRPFTRINSRGNLEVSQLKNYLLVKARTILSTIWANEGHLQIGHISPVLPAIFASWITDTLNLTYRLDPVSFIKLRIISAHYYKCLHSNATELDPSNLRALAAVLARQLFVSPSEVEEVIQDVGVITDIEDFVAKVKSHLKSPLLERFDTAVLVTRMGGTWYGFGGADMAVCALEHPPTFVAMVYLAYSDRGYKSAGLTNVVERFRKEEGVVVRETKRLIDNVENYHTN